MEGVVRYIVEHLDEAIDLREVADHACLSRFHFHRVFQALLGESVGDLVRRLRLERAAGCLRSTDVAITEIAFEAGYATHEAFIRAFRAAFGCTPSTMRHRSDYDGRLPTPNGIHFGAAIDIRFVSSRGDTNMKLEIRELQPRKAVCMSHSGPYFMIGQTFGKIGAWLKENNVETQEGVGLYYDDPESTSADQLRSDAGAFVAASFTTVDPAVHIVDVAGGAYAVAVHTGPYDGLPNAWGELMGTALPEGYTYRSGSPFELYVNDMMTTPSEKLVTELWVPAQKA